MKGQSLFFREKRKNIISWSSAEFAKGVAEVKQKKIYVVVHSRCDSGTLSIDFV